MEQIIIRGGLVVDGTGRPGYRADIAVNGGRITRIGDLTGCSAQKELDAGGLVVAPGFIDAHAHSDTSFLRDTSCASKLYQGVTTEVTGQCGSSPFPALPGRQEQEDDGHWSCLSFADFLERFRREGRCMATNQAMLVGHGSLRAGVIGYADREATDEELEQMKELLRRDLASGAWGMSLGLEYSPGFFAAERELVQLAAVAAEFDGLVPCHMRSEGLKIGEAIGELVQIGRQSGAKVHISHLKIDHFRAHGQAERVWRIIDQAQKNGVRLSADMYPFTASWTNLTIRCPKWSQEGGNEGVCAFLKGPRRQEIVEGIREHYFSAQRAETCLISDDGGLWPEIIGKTLRYVAEEMLRTTDYAEAAAQIIERTKGQAGCVFFVMSEDDMLSFLSRDIGIGSDGYALSADPQRVGYKPHPRSYAALAEFFRIAREKRLCTLEEAVRRVTSKAADMIGLMDRGRIAEGLAADIAVFDPDEIAPRATYFEPVRLAKGVRHVLVNGRIAMENEMQTDIRAGEFLRKGNANGEGRK